MEYLFLSHYYNESTPGYGGKKDFSLKATRSMSKGDSCNQLSFEMSNHVGTHIDLPFHFDPKGQKLNDYSPQDWIFSQICLLEIPLKAGELLSPHHFSTKPNPNVEFLIIKTGFENHRNSDLYWNQNPGLNSELADFLREEYKNLRVLGFDFISATSFTNKEEGKKAHRAFLAPAKGRPLLILEDMRLSPLSSETVFSTGVISPLLIDKADGVPVTVFVHVDRKKGLS